MRARPRPPAGSSRRPARPAPPASRAAAGRRPTTRAPARCCPERRRRPRRCPPPRRDGRRRRGRPRPVRRGSWPRRRPRRRVRAPASPAGGGRDRPRRRPSGRPPRPRSRACRRYAGRPGPGWRRWPRPVAAWRPAGRSAPGTRARRRPRALHAYTRPSSPAATTSGRRFARDVPHRGRAEEAAPHAPDPPPQRARPAAAHRARPASGLPSRAPVEHVHQPRRSWPARSRPSAGPPGWPARAPTRRSCARSLREAALEPRVARHEEERPVLAHVALLVTGAQAQGPAAGAQPARDRPGQPPHPSVASPAACDPPPVRRLLAAAELERPRSRGAPARAANARAAGRYQRGDTMSASGGIRPGADPLDRARGVHPPPAGQPVPALAVALARDRSGRPPSAGSPA